MRRITRGDVEAVLNAFGGGGRAVLLHSKTAEVPGDFVGSHGSIRPFAGSPWDGAHFCADDWHVILIADFEGGDASFGHDDAARIMNGLEVSFTLDGAALPTTRTAIKRFVNPGSSGFRWPTTSSKARSCRRPISASAATGWKSRWWTHRVSKASTTGSRSSSTYPAPEPAYKQHRACGAVTRAYARGAYIFEDAKE